jgi:ribosomal protein S18 acetylase RimI-like enzyme
LLQFEAPERRQASGKNRANGQAMDFQVLKALEPETQDAIYGMLRAYNRASSPEFYSARDLPENAPQPLNVVALDEQGIVLGGVIAETQFAWLKVSYLVVATEQRHYGIGRRLMMLAEHEAGARGCRYAYVDTMDYQAPEFYRKLGYQLAGRLDDWDSHGHAKHFFTKRLVAP